jgi:hypothetical protein
MMRRKPRSVVPRFLTQGEDEIARLLDARAAAEPERAASYRALADKVRHAHKQPDDLRQQIVHHAREIAEGGRRWT